MAQDDRFATNDARVRNRDELVPRVAAIMKMKTVSGWLEDLQREGIPAGPINDIGQAFSEDQAEFRDLATQIEDDTGVAVPTVRSPLRLSATPPVLHTAPPRVGQHTFEVLREIAGMDEERIRELHAQGIVALEDSSPD